MTTRSRRIRFIEPGSRPGRPFNAWIRRWPLLGPVILGSILHERGHDVAVYNENVSGPLEGNASALADVGTADVVGITIMTATANRGYELARRIRATAAGRPTVVFGGPHATFMPDEAARYGDLVVCGEGENVIEVNVQDRAGNTTNVRRVVKYGTSPLTPGLPTVLTDLPYPLLIGGGVFLGALWLILAYWRQPVSVSLSADRQTLYPGRPEEGEVVILALGLSRVASTTVEVLDAQDQLMALWWG